MKNQTLFGPASFSIAGIRLNASKDQAQKLVPVPSEVSSPANRLEVWTWTREQATAGITPLHIHWVDGKVSQISGFNLTVAELLLDRLSSSKDVIKAIPYLKQTKRLFRGFRLEDPLFYLKILMAPNGNQYLLSFAELEQTWADVMYSVLNPQ